MSLSTSSIRYCWPAASTIMLGDEARLGIELQLRRAGGGEALQLPLRRQRLERLADR